MRVERAGGMPTQSRLVSFLNGPPVATRDNPGVYALDSEVRRGGNNGNTRKGCLTLRKISLTLAATFVGGLIAMAFGSAPALATTHCQMAPDGHTAAIVDFSSNLSYTGTNINAHGCYYGIWVGPWADLTLKGTRVQGASYAGIYASLADSVSLTYDSSVTSNGVWGIVVNNTVSTDSVNISYSSVYGNGTNHGGAKTGGVFVTGNGTVNVKHSNFNANHGYGLLVDNANVNSEYTTYTQNSFDGIKSENGDNGYSGDVSFSSWGDTFKYNYGSGIKVLNNASVTVHGAYIYHNSYDGVQALGANSVTVDCSRIFYNGHDGIDVENTSGDVSFYSDTIIGNHGTGFVGNNNPSTVNFDHVNIEFNSVGFSLMSYQDFAAFYGSSYVANNGPMGNSDNFETVDGTQFSQGNNTFIQPNNL